MGGDHDDGPHWGVMRDYIQLLTSQISKVLKISSSPNCHKMTDREESSYSHLEKLPKDVFGNICKYIQLRTDVMGLFLSSRRVKKLVMRNVQHIWVPRGIQGMYDRYPNSTLVRAIAPVTRLYGTPPELISRLNIDLDSILIDELVAYLPRMLRLNAINLTGETTSIPNDLFRDTGIIHMSMEYYTKDNAFAFPEKLKKLSMHVSETFSILLPSTLEELHLTSTSKKGEAELNLPVSLKVLDVTFKFNNTFTFKWPYVTLLNSLTITGDNFRQNNVIVEKSVKDNPDRVIDLIRILPSTAPLTLEKMDIKVTLKLKEAIWIMKWVSTNLHTLHLNLDLGHEDAEPFALCFRPLKNLRNVQLKLSEHTVDLYRVLAPTLSENVKLDLFCQNANLEDLLPVANKVSNLTLALGGPTTVDLTQFGSLKNVIIIGDPPIRSLLWGDTPWKFPASLKTCTLPLIYQVQHESMALFAKTIFANHPNFSELYVPALPPSDPQITKRLFYPLYLRIHSSRGLNGTYLTVTRDKWYTGSKHVGQVSNF